MKQIDEKKYTNGKYLELKKSYKNYNDLKNAWYTRSDIKRIPSVFIIKGKINDVIDYDINPIGNTKIIKEDEISYEIEKNIKEYLESPYKIEIGISGRFEVKSSNSIKVAEKIYDILLKYIS